MSQLASLQGPLSLKHSISRHSQHASTSKSLYLVEIEVSLCLLKVEHPPLLGREASQHLVENVIVSFIFGLEKKRMSDALILMIINFSTYLFDRIDVVNCLI